MFTRVTRTIRRLALVAGVGLGVVGMGLAAPAAWAASAIEPDNVPTAIPGATNGALPASDLVNVAPDCAAARAAAPSLGLLFAEARDRDVVLGAEQCYRSLADEQAEAQIYTGLGNPACAAPVLTSPTGGAVGTSMHGWGKAADLFDVDGSLGFGSPGYVFMKTFAAQLGWNHPGWAEPGGSACPEAWHWEWVGDGGTEKATPIRADVVGLLPSRDGKGYASVSGLGALRTRGDFPNLGSTASTPINWLVVGDAATPDGHGYWLVGSDGGIFTFGDAGFFGSTGGLSLRAPVVGMAPTANGGGYWLVGADGGIFTFGDASFFGSMGGIPLDAPIVGMAPTPDGRGYWEVASDGGIFTFGDARFRGSMGGTALNSPIVGMAATPDGRGYWLVAADGGVFNFGDAGFYGSTGAAPPAEPVVSITPTRDGKGYWLTTAGGAVRAFGDATALGSV